MSGVYEVDWDAVEVDYRVGILSDKDICLKHGITIGVLQKNAEKAGWTQTIRTPEEEADILARAGTFGDYNSSTPQLEPRFPIDSIFTADEVKKKNLLTAGQVITAHRKDIADLRGISSEMTKRLNNYLLDPDNEESKMGLYKILGAKEGPSDLLEKLSRVITRLVTIEREAYGMTTLSIDNEAGEEDVTSRKIDELKQSLLRITNDKAQKEGEAKEEPLKPDPVQEKKSTPPPVTKAKPLVGK